MKKYFIILLGSFVLFFQGQVMSRDVDEMTAKVVAKNFIYERMAGDSRPDYRSLKAESIIAITSETGTVMYAVSFNIPGYAIVAATKKTFPILAYSFTDRYTGLGIPPAMENWLSSYKEQIGYILDNGPEPTQAVKAEWERLSATQPDNLIIKADTGVEPLITTTWNQGTYYNEMCPADPQGPSGHCYTGCVATAMGQVCNYFRWPLSGTGSYSYSCPPYGTLSADFENTTYRWDEMPLYVTTSNPPIAELLYHLGVSVDMVYGPNGSGMYNHKAAFSLRTYFKYSPETQYVYRDSTGMDWDSLLVSHLDRHIPMYYAGWSVPNINGHAFVCDGYQDGNYYHFNWGWGGSYDGYFYTDDLSPGGSNFNLAQELIINAVPDTNQYSYPPYCQGTKVSETIEGTIDDGSGPIYDYQANSQCSWLISPSDSVEQIKISVINFSTENNDFLRIYDGEDASAPLLAELSGDTIPDEMTSSGDKVYITFETDGAGTAPGWLLSYTSEIPLYCFGMQNLTVPSGEFSDGSGRMNYHNGTNCIWVIDPNGDPDVLVIEFSEFETEEENDVLKIYDYFTQDLLAEYSGQYSPLPDPVIIESQKAFITFSTNSTVTAPGWTANYYITPLHQNEKNGPGLFSVYPNPVKDNLNFSFYAAGEQEADISVSSIEGKLIFKESLTVSKGINKKTILIPSGEKGVYLLNIRTVNKNYMRKVVIM